MLEKLCEYIFVLSALFFFFAGMHNLRETIDYRMAKEKYLKRCQQLEPLSKGQSITTESKHLSTPMEEK